MMLSFPVTHDALHSHWIMALSFPAVLKKTVRGTLIRADPVFSFPAILSLNISSARVSHCILTRNTLDDTADMVTKLLY